MAPRDIFATDFDRQLYRVTVVGQPLQGINGSFSTAVQGRPIVSAEEELAEHGGDAAAAAAAAGPGAQRARI